MADHSDEKEGRVAGLKPDDLIERLTRRLNEPAGVIDVRYAQQKYARIMNWIVERFGLVDQLRARYGVEDARAAGSQLLMIEQPLGEQINYFSTTSQSFSSAMAARSLPPVETNQPISSEARPSSFAEIINAHSTGPAAESSPSEGTFRVSRRAPQLILKSGADSPAPQSQSTNAQGISESSSDVQTMPSPVYAKSEIEREKKSQPHAAEESESPKGSPGATIKSETESAASSPIAQQVSVEPVKAASSETGSPFLVLAKSRVESLKPITAQELPLSAAASEIKSEAIKDNIKGAASSPTMRQAGIEIVKSEPSERSPVSSLPLAKTLAGPMQIEDHQQSSAQQSIETAPAAQASRKTVVASEISDDSLSRAKPDIVWRKSSDSPTADSTGRDVGGRATAARQTGSSASLAKEQQAGETPAPSKAQARSDEIRIEQISPQVIRTISEQVIRAISFDLKVERERRGMSKWR